MWERIHLAFDCSFLHTEGRWLQPGSWVGYDYYRDPRAYEDLARLAERGGLDMLFFGDGTGIPDTWESSLDGAVRWGIQWPRHDSTPLVAAMSRAAQRIGFAVTFASTYMHPYYVARLLTSLDHLTAGRIGLNLVTSSRLSDAANFGLDVLPGHGARYDRMEEFVAVCRQLWDSVAGDAVVLDRDAGAFADPARVRPIRHQGRYFTVRGPLNCLPSPQGHPVLIQAGASPRGIQASARFADVVFAPGRSAADTRRHRAALDAALAVAGRSADDTGVLWGIHLVIAESRAAARQMQLDRAAALPLEAGGVYLSHNSGFDVAQLPDRFTLGELRERVEAAQGSQSGLAHQLATDHGDSLVMSRDELLDLGRQSIVGLDRAVTGTPAQVADTLEELHEAGGARGGFMITRADVMPGSLTAVVEQLVPELQRRGRYRTEYEQATLRGLLRGARAPDDRLAGLSHR